VTIHIEILIIVPHRHVDRHRENGLAKPLPRQRDDDDARDGLLQTFSKGWREHEGTPGAPVS
jgi:hypothetical protein